MRIITTKHKFKPAFKKGCNHTLLNSMYMACKYDFDLFRRKVCLKVFIYHLKQNSNFYNHSNNRKKIKIRLSFKQYKNINNRK